MAAPRGGELPAGRRVVLHVARRDRARPFIDGVVLTRSPWMAFSHGEQLAVPLIIGSNTWEGSLIQYASIGQKGRELADSASVKELYRQETLNEDERAQRLFGDIVFVAPARWIARMQARLAPSWLYRFGYLHEGQRGKLPGVPHGGEIPYVFDTLGRSYGTPRNALSQDDIRMASTVADCWAAFARTGEPNCGLGAWNRYSRNHDNTMDIENDGGHETTRLRATILDAVERYFAPDRKQ